MKSGLQRILRNTALSLAMMFPFSPTLAQDTPKPSNIDTSTDKATKKKEAVPNPLEKLVETTLSPEKKSKKLWEDTKCYTLYQASLNRHITLLDSIFGGLDKSSKDYKALLQKRAYYTNDAELVEYVYNNVNVKALEKLILEKYNLFKKISGSDIVRFPSSKKPEEEDIILSKGKKIFRTELEQLLYSTIGLKPKTPPPIKECKEGSPGKLHYIFETGEVHIAVTKYYKTPHSIAGVLVHEFAHDIYCERSNFPSYILNEGFAEYCNREVAMKLAKKGNNEYLESYLTKQISMLAILYKSLCKDNNVPVAPWLESAVTKNKILIYFEGLTYHGLGIAILELEENKQGKNIYKKLINNDLSFLKVELEQGKEETLK